VGWFGGNCNRCVPCRQGHFMQCERGQVPSLHYPGGYAESVTVPATALARIPDGLSFVEAAPMGCAGVTTFNGLRQTRAKAGDLVAVLGIGGLGHLGVQFARAMGFETVAIARGAEREGPPPRNSARTTTSTRAPPTSPPNSNCSAARRSCSRRRRVRRRWPPPSAGSFRRVSSSPSA
jgi:alcohol dehydrogenase